MRRLIFAIIMMLWCCESFAQYDTLQVSTSVTTHIMFAEELVYVDIPSRFVTAKIVDGNRKILALRAKESFDDVATVSVLENDGNLRTFILGFEPYPEDLIYRFDVQGTNDADTAPIPLIDSEGLSGFKRKLYHIADREYGITVQCYDISTANDKTTLVLSLKNQSVLSYQASSPRFVIEGRKSTRKKPQIEKTIYPVSCTIRKISVSPGGEIIAAYSFDKLTLMKDQVLKVYFYENDGMRNYVITITIRDIWKSR